MAVPSYRQASTGTTDATGAWTHTGPVPFAAGNFYLVHVLQDGVAADVAIDSVTNAEALDGTDNTLTKIGEFDVGSAVAASQHLWVGRALNTSAMVITGSNAGGDDVYVRVYEFFNVSTGTTLAEVIENSSAGGTTNSAGTSATAEDASVTTLGYDRLVVNLVGVNDDNAISEFTGETGGDWFLQESYADSGGTDGAIGLQLAYVGPLSINPGFNSTTAEIVGGTAGAGEDNQQQAQSFSLTSGATIASVICVMQKVSSPTDDMQVEIQTDSGGAPSGTLVGATGSVPAADITAFDTAVTFTVNATLSASTTYWVVMKRSGARDAVNFFRISRSPAAGPYAGGTGASRNSNTWADQIWDYFITLQVAGGGTINGGTASIVDSDPWGAAGFALIGTTPPAPPVLYYVTA